MEYPYKVGHLVKVPIGQNCFQYHRLTKQDIENKPQCEPITFDINAVKSAGMQICEMNGYIYEVIYTIVPKPPLQCFSLFSFKYENGKFYASGKQINYLHEAMDEILNFANR